MRPRRLVIKGFRSYAAEATFDFDERGLVGIVGPIGSGKSSLLDAVSFALYGQTPTVGKQTKSLINQRQQSSHVELWFDVGAETWRSVRALRRKGQSAHSLERYGAIDGERLDIIEGEKAVNARVTEMLGLDFHAFGRSVLLAQNQFARFLDATGGERDSVLKGVFGLDRIEVVRELAKDHRDAAARDLEELERRRAEVDADRAALAEALEQRQPAAERAAAFEAAAEVAATIAAAEASAAAEAKGAQAAVIELNALASRLPSRTETARLLAASLADSDAIEAATKIQRQGHADLEAAQAALDAVVAEMGDREALARLEAEAGKLADLAEAAAGSAKLAELAAVSHSQAIADADAAAAALAAATATVAAAEAGATEAAAALKKAEMKLHEARHAEMASALRQDLHAGDACPVCGQTVADVAPAALAAAEKTVVGATTDAGVTADELKVAQGSLTKASAASAAAAARLEEARAALDARTVESARQRELLETARAGLAASLGDGEPGATLAARRRALENAESNVAERVKAKAGADKALADATEAARRRLDEMQRLATEVAALGGTLGADIASSPDRNSLSAALDELRQVWETNAAAAEDAVKESARRIESAQRDRAQLHESLGLAAGDDFSAARMSAQSALAAVGEKVAMLEKRVDRVTALEKENAATVQRLATYNRLVDDLAPSKFLAFLLDEERVALAALAAERFELLSGGRYRYSEDGSFDVLDLTAADAVRKSTSLSGGETFLASLALALALAEMVSRSGGRLGAFFLDEGFGSLDAEHLDLAMEGVERIVADDPTRLVLVVSHVPELRQRLEDVIRLDKDPVTGDTVVVRS